jgi:hypothetical protein
MADDDYSVHWKEGDMLRDLYPPQRRHLIEVVVYPGTGHLLEPAYTPHCKFCFNKPFGEFLSFSSCAMEPVK